MLGEFNTLKTQYLNLQQLNEQQLIYQYIYIYLNKNDIKEYSVMAAI